MKKWILAAVMSILLITPALAQETTELPPTKKTYQALTLFGYIFDQLRRNHVAAPTEKELIDAAVKGMMEVLEKYDDKHSAYIPPESFKNMMESQRGRYFGIGARVEWNATVKGIIMHPMEGSPALRDGIKDGDIVIQIDDTLTSELNDLQKSIKKIKGPADTVVKLKVIRKDVSDPLIISVTRGKIEQKIVDYRVIDDDIMYIRLMQFTENGFDKMVEAIEDMMTQERLTPPKGLILDLRFNPGGLLGQAVKVTDMFLDEGLIVETRPRNHEHGTKAYATEGQAIPKDMPIVILINQHSASASEIVSGTLKDLRRATIIGVKSFGKGSVQSVRSLPNGGGLKVTIARYYTAGGTSPHGVGISPHIKVSLPENYWKTISPEKRLKHVGPQLQRAIDFLHNFNSSN